MRKIIFVLAILLNLSCEDRLSKEKYDVKFYLTNKTKATIPEIKVESITTIKKVWSFKNVEPGKVETLSFNIKRDLGVSEGGFLITAYLNEKDSLQLNDGYFTNGQYLDAVSTKFSIYENKIEGEK